MADMQQIDMIIRRHKWGWIGHTMRRDESLVAQQAMQWNALNGIGRKMVDPARHGDELWKGSTRM